MFPKKENSVNPPTPKSLMLHTHHGQEKQIKQELYSSMITAEQSLLALLPLTERKWFHSKFPEEKKTNPNLVAPDQR